MIDRIKLKPEEQITFVFFYYDENINLDWRGAYDEGNVSRADSIVIDVYFGDKILYNIILSNKSITKYGALFKAPIPIRDLLINHDSNKYDSFLLKEEKNYICEQLREEIKKLDKKTIGNDGD